ncbi:phage tail tape measure protein [Curtobacterium sp. 1544]|uniref:phage tail tape measure protein n=1 Tax=Curtobacterium sp. 1544 TaxID=3156417 RepID=UPI003392A544
MANKTAILAVKILGDAAGAQKSAREAEKAVDGLEEHVQKAKDGLNVAGAAAGVALAAGVVGAVENAQVGNKLAGQLALDPQESARLGKINGDLFADAYGDSLEQVAEASRQVIGNIDGMRDANDATMRDITAKVLDVSTTFDQDLGGVTTAVGQLMRTGMAPDAQAALDIITSGLQGNARASEDLIDTFTEYPALFQRLGLDGQTAVGLIDQGLAAGARNTDLVADALKEFQIRATDGSATSAAGFEALGLNAQQATAQIAAGGDSASAGLQDVLDRLRGIEDPVQRNAAAVALFGTQAEDLGDALFALDPSSAVQALGDVEGAAKRLDDTVGQDQGFEKLKRTVTTTFTDIGAAALPVLEPVLTLLQQWAPVLGPLALVVAAVAGAVTLYSGAMKVFAAVQAIQTAAQWASNAAWLANPITWIVLGIIVVLAAVVTAIVLVVTHWDNFRKNGAAAVEWVGQKVEGFKNGIIDAWNWVSTLVSALYEIATFNFGSGFDKLSSLFGGGASARTVEIAAADTRSVSRMATFARAATVAAAPAPTVSGGWSALAGTAGTSDVARGGDTYNIDVSAGVGDPVEIGRTVVKAIKTYRTTTGQLKPGEAFTW